VAMQNKFYKENESDQIWWVENDSIGVWEFSFDKKKIYNFFRDYPQNMTDEEVAIFKRENAEMLKYLFKS
jgi:hypothetical protein